MLVYLDVVMHRIVRSLMFVLESGANRFLAFSVKTLVIVVH